MSMRLKPLETYLRRTFQHIHSHIKETLELLQRVIIPHHFYSRYHALLQHEPSDWHWTDWGRVCDGTGLSPDGRHHLWRQHWSGPQWWNVGTCAVYCQWIIWGSICYGTGLSTDGRHLWHQHWCKSANEPTFHRQGPPWRWNVGSFTLFFFHRVTLIILKIMFIAPG